MMNMNRSVTFLLLALILGVAMGAPEEQKKKPQRVRRGLINVQKQSAQDKFQLMSNEFGEGDMRDLQEEDLRFLQDDMSMSMSMPKSKGKSKGRR